MSNWNIDPTEATDALITFLKIPTLPVAVKFVDNLDNWPPADFSNPSTMGYKMAFCQVVSAVRNGGHKFALDAKDIMCGAALLSFGWVEFESGFNRKEEVIKFLLDAKYAKDKEAAQKQLENMPLLSGEFKFPSKGLLMAPLNSGAIEDPDVILIYGNSAQTIRLAQSMIYMTGETITSEAKVGISCANAMVMPMLKNKPTFVVPGRGERSLGMAGKDELCFALPAGDLDTLITGVKTTQEAGSKYPSPQYLFFEPKMGPVQTEFAEKMMSKVSDV